MRHDCLVLAFHSVSAETRSPLHVSPMQLESFVSQLLHAGYRATTATEAMLGRVPHAALAVTFDDGDDSVATAALPVLRDLGIVGTLFLPTMHLARAASMVDRLLAAGWEIGSHGHLHRPLARLSDAELEEELAGSKERLTCVTGRCSSIAYPYSDVSTRVVDAAERAGYVAGYTVATSPSAGPLAWPRVGLGSGDSQLSFGLKTSRVGRAIRQLPIGQPLASAVRATLERGDHRRQRQSHSSSASP